MVARHAPFGGNQSFIVLLALIILLVFLSGRGIGIGHWLRDPVLLIGLAAAFLIAITFHEFMHAYAADRMGDPTGRLLGRMTLNPMAHLDVLGTLFFVLFRFGWGKPVPVNYGQLRGGRRGGMAVAFAGPATNFVIAALFGIPFQLGVAGAIGPEYERILGTVVFFNVLLGIFNLVPIPPLDGSKVLYGVVPPRMAWSWPQFEMFGPFLLILLLFAFPPFLQVLSSLTFALSGVFAPGALEAVFAP